jgi:hypothetical protein
LPVELRNAFAAPPPKKHFPIRISPAPSLSMSKQGDALDGDGLCARHRVREAGLRRNALTTVNIVTIRGLNGAGRPPSWRRGFQRLLTFCSCRSPRARLIDAPDSTAGRHSKCISRTTTIAGR